MMRAVLAWIVICVLAGCGARQAETRDPNVVVCAWIAGPDGFDPLVTASSSAVMIDNLIYTPLVDMDTAPNMLPHWPTSLAYRVNVSELGTRYVLRLRRGVRWSDGAALTAKDVVFAVKLGRNRLMPRSFAGDFTLMRSVRALDAHTVEIRLAKPSPPFLENALGETFALPEHVLGRYPPETEREAKFVIGDTAFSQHPTISGPWRILRNLPESSLVIGPNPLYWGPKPKLDEIAFRVYPEQDSIYAAVDAGEVDVSDIPPNLWRIHGRLRGDHRFVTWPWNVAFALVPNYRQTAWIGDPVVKRGMMYALDRRFITGGIMSGQADILNGPLPTFSPYYNKHVKTYAYDPAESRRLLDADGWRLRGGVRMKNGNALRITLKTEGATDAVGSDVAELVQANLRAVGIDCVLENEELQTFFSDELASNFQLALRGVILLPYPDDYKYVHSTQTRANGGFNEGFYRNRQIDRALETARTAPSPRIARPAQNRYQMLASEDLPELYLYSVRLGAVVPKNLTGLSLTPLAPAALPMGQQFWRR
ncbi:MAG: peptide ABC transporter substrate-binding protein [Candidatus Eremiobacteraeota bacterium]|nr:peptide ABC transporter substrate-binding protein [Candidatus Eremiobacteraeota bacterium]